MLLAVAVTVAFGLTLWHVGLLQTANADTYVAEGDTQRLRTVALPGDRGTIFDRNGYELAMSVPSVIALLLEPLPTAKKMTTRNEVTTAKTARRLRS